MLIRYDIEKSKAIKSYKEIETLDGDSVDIFCPSVIDNHYSPNRPEELKTMSLYKFVQWHDITKIKLSKKIIHYKINNGYYLKRRQRECLINHYRYDVNTQPEKYFFSLFLMFKP